MRLNRDDDELTRYRKAITADTIALTPPLIISDNQIDELIEKVKKCILAVA